MGARLADIYAQNASSGSSSGTYLLVPERLDRIESSRAGGRQQSEQNPGERARGKRGDHRRDGRRRRNGGERRLDADGHEDAEHQANSSADAGQGRGLNQELPEYRALRRAERLAHSDLAGALG